MSWPKRKLRNGRPHGCSIHRSPRAGTNTMPTAIRGKLGIKKRTGLELNTKDDRMVFTKNLSLSDLAGTSKLTKGEAFKILDKIREEE